MVVTPPLSGCDGSTCSTYTFELDTNVSYLPGTARAKLQPIWIATNHKAAGLCEEKFKTAVVHTQTFNSTGKRFTMSLWLARMKWKMTRTIDTEWDHANQQALRFVEQLESSGRGSEKSVAQLWCLELAPVGCKDFCCASGSRVPTRNHGQAAVNPGHWWRTMLCRATGTSEGMYQ